MEYIEEEEEQMMGRSGWGSCKSGMESRMRGDELAMPRSNTIWLGDVETETVHWRLATGADREKELKTLYNLMIKMGG